MDKTQEALKLAQDWYDSGHEDPDEFTAMIKAVMTLAEQPAQQQEPVAIVEAVVPHLESIIVKHILDAPFPRVGDFIYTSPPASKPWVGLTDEEIEQVCVPLGAAMLSFTEVARAIEAKLKEKNT